MNTEKTTISTDATQQENDRPALVKKIGRTTYRVHIHFSTTSTETMSDKIKRMLKNEIQQM
ncbi:MAG: transposon-encoded TnpW family protein [Lachnospiraceae bacterium]|nr:transposon-encoded TnpW family protein [Lachnospiraceae bacterium]